MKRNMPMIVLSLAAAFVLQPAQAQTPDSCSKLADLKISGGTITSAKLVAEGPFVRPGGPGRGGPVPQSAEPLQLIVA